MYQPQPRSCPSCHCFAHLVIAFCSSHFNSFFHYCASAMVTAAQVNASSHHVIMDSSPSSSSSIHFSDTMSSESLIGKRRSQRRSHTDTDITILTTELRSRFFEEFSIEGKDDAEAEEGSSSSYYTLGESLLLQDDSRFERNITSVTSISMLKVHDMAFIKRSDKTWSCGILAARYFRPRQLHDGDDEGETEEVMLFVISSSGLTKAIGERNWSKYIKCQRPTNIMERGGCIPKRRTENKPIGKRQTIVRFSRYSEIMIY